MPENFTRAFADRLNRYTGLKVREASGAEAIEPGLVFIAPGGKNLRVQRKGQSLITDVLEAATDAKYVPSIDLLFRSAAEAMGPRVMGVLLTGMGADGREGIRAIKRSGGITVAESQDTAVIFGMPREAIDTGQVDRVLRLEKIPEEISQFAKSFAADANSDSEREEH